MKHSRDQLLSKFRSMIARKEPIIGAVQAPVYLQNVKRQAVLISSLSITRGATVWRVEDHWRGY